MAGKMNNEHPMIITLFIALVIWLYMSHQSYVQLQSEYYDYIYFVHQTIEKHPEIKKEILEYERSVQEYKEDETINHIGRFD